MKRWEYTWLYRGRGVKAPGLFGNVSLRDASDWEPVYFTSKLGKLGEEGWELIAVVPRSSFAGDAGQVLHLMKCGCLNVN